MPQQKTLGLKFPKNEHGNCRELTHVTIENIPRDGSLGQPRRYQQNAEVWRPGDRTDRLYFLMSGAVRLETVDLDGREIIVGIIAPGEPFGELCFCDGPTAHRRTTARATAASTAIEIRVEDFVGFMQLNGEVLGRMLFTFCVRLSRAERRVEILALRGAEERLGNLLLHLAEINRVNSGDVEANQLAKIIVTHDELAALAALSRQRVTLTMNEFRTRGLVSYNRNQPLLIDTAALRRYLDNAANRTI